MLIIPPAASWISLQIQPPLEPLEPVLPPLDPPLVLPTGAVGNGVVVDDPNVLVDVAGAGAHVMLDDGPAGCVVLPLVEAAWVSLFEKAIAAVTRRGAQDWDIAGAACILNETGIPFEDVCIGPLRFNRPEIRHGALAALGVPSLKPVLHAALVKVYGCPQPQEIDLERTKS